MVGQIDTAEAFAPIARLRTAAAVIVSMTLVLAIVAAVGVARAFAHPIVRLTAMTRALASGDLSRRIEVSAANEIGELAASFNDMAGQLVASMARLQATTAAKERIESELRVAHDIQMSMVPKLFPAFPERPEFDIYGHIVPAREVSGDFYDFFSSTRRISALPLAMCPAKASRPRSSWWSQKPCCGRRPLQALVRMQCSRG
jgi:sigma-B regulation protein RsbU (phosphoserine phosphatase)